MIEIHAEGIKLLLDDIDHNIAVVSDFSPILDGLVDDVIIPRIREIFQSEGEGTWPPRITGGTWPLLIRTGQLYRSLTSTYDSNNVFDVSRTGLEFGTTLDYAEYVERDRPILDLLGQFFENDVLTYIDRKLQESFR